MNFDFFLFLFKSLYVDLQLIVLRSNSFYGLENLSKSDVQTAKHFLYDNIGLGLGFEEFLTVIHDFSASHDTLTLWFIIPF
jgi:hypothetical protein